MADEDRTFDSKGPIPVKVFEPTGTGKHPAVVVVHGTRGLEGEFGPAITEFAGKLAEAGYLAVIPYFTSTPTKPAHNPDEDFQVIAAFRPNHDRWLEILGDCLTFATGPANAVAGRAGLLGFSMGGNLALRLATRGTGVKIAAVVDFFAPINMLGGIGGDAAKLPPVQIHHGLEDGKPDRGPVPPSESEALVTALEKALKVKGTDFEFHTYEGQGHGFKGEGATTSTKRTVEFFDKHLK